MRRILLGVVSSNGATETRSPMNPAKKRNQRPIVVESTGPQGFHQRPTEEELRTLAEEIVEYCPSLAQLLIAVACRKASYMGPN